MLARWTRRAALTAAIGVGAVMSGVAPLGAVGLTPFSTTPASGPAGTAITVSGTGCAPGLLLSSSLDRVAVTVASTPPASVQIPVSSSGAWSDTVTVPANAASGPALVTALCFTDGLQSLLTIYQPNTFTITATAAPSTTQPVTTTVPGSTHRPPATNPPPVEDTTPTTRPGPTRDTRPGGGGGDGGSVAGPGGGSTSGDGASTTTAAKRNSSGARHDGRVAVAADLRTPQPAGAGASGAAHGLGWIGWLALALLIAGLAAGGVLFRHYRSGEDPVERSP